MHIYIHIYIYIRLPRCIHIYICYNIYIYIFIIFYTYIIHSECSTPNQLLICSSSAPPRPGICECWFYLGQMNPLKRPKFESKRTGHDSGFKYRVVSHRFRDPLWDSGIPSEIVVGKDENLLGNHRHLWGPGWLVRHKPSKPPQVFEHKLYKL